jgi:hypothetical protein
MRVSGRKSVPERVETSGAVNDPAPTPHRSTTRLDAGQVIAIGDAARWPDWLESLVSGGYRVEVVPDAERAFVRCVERMVDLVLVGASTAIDEGDPLERLRRLSPCTRILLIGEASERGAATRDCEPASDEPVRAIPSTLSTRAFEREVQAAVRGCRMARERRERIDQLRSLVNRITDPAAGSTELPAIVERFPEEHEPAPMPAMSLETLKASMRRELDALQAARDTVDFIAGCLPEATVAVWLAGTGTHLGLAACSGHHGASADATVRLMARVERLHLPRHMASGGIASTDDVSGWGHEEDRVELEGRWAMIAPCRADGRCHAAILLLGPRGPRPLPAEAAMDSVRLLLGEHLGRIERVHLRAASDWNVDPEVFDPVDEDPGQD